MSKSMLDESFIVQVRPVCRECGGPLGRVGESAGRIPGLHERFDQAMLSSSARNICPGSRKPMVLP